jgi:hypothetical protein
MALIVRKPNVKVDGRQLDIGEIIPKEYETDPDRDWSSAISLGRVDRIPDGAIDDNIPETFVDNADILNQSVSDLQDELDKITDFDSLDELKQIEKSNKNRKTALQAIDDRYNELLNHLSGENE